jgi:hypothetical protein
MNALLWACTLSVATATTTRGHALASPVAKVVKLLTDMQTDLKAEADKDEENYDTMMCWCATNKKEKTKSIEDAELAITSLTAEIETRTAKDDQLGKEIAKHEASAKSLLEQLDSQAAQRDKEGKENQAKIIDLTKNIAALHGAITVLKKHQALFFPQIKVEFLQQELQSIQRGPADDKFSEWMASHDYGKLSKEDSARVSKFEASVRKADEAKKEKLYDGYTFAEMQTLARAKRVMKAFAQYTPDYAPQSGEIFGILTQLKEQMEEDLKELEGSEATAKTDYAGMVDELKAQLEAEEDNAKRKTAEKVENGRALAAAKTDLEDNEKTLEADTGFLKNVNTSCDEFDKAWEERRKTRAEELLAVSEAIGILTEEDAMDTSKAALGNDVKSDIAAFLQMKSTRAHTSVRTLSAKALQRVASKTHNAAMMQLSAAVQLDGFEQVKKAINEMIADLKTQQADEVKHQDFCNTEFQANEMENISKAQTKKDLEVHIGVLEDKNETLTTTKATTQTELADLKVEIQKANIQRVETNQEFQQTMADQKATRKVLGKALDRLQQFYADKALLQKKSMTLLKKKQAPPVQVTEYKKHGGAASVTVMLQNLITETKQLEAEATDGEKEAQASYEQFMTESNALMVAKMEAIVNLGKELAATEEDLINAETDLQNTIDDMEEIAATVADLHSACDFVLKNFGLRQKARGEEIEALQEALGILSGALN